MTFASKSANSEAEAESPPTCSLEGCKRRRYSRGWCCAHYNRWFRTGDVGSVETGRRKATVGYGSAHDRVRKAKGSASDYPCHECGGPATDWCYTNDDPNELTEAVKRSNTPLRYSLDVDRYVPMCRSCHFRFDGRELSLSPSTITADEVDEWIRENGSGEEI